MKTWKLELTISGIKYSDVSGDKFIILAKMVKCALALCHSNADVERSLSVNKRS